MTPTPFPVPFLSPHQALTLTTLEYIAREIQRLTALLGPEGDLVVALGSDLLTEIKKMESKSSVPYPNGHDLFL